MTKIEKIHKVANEWLEDYKPHTLEEVYADPAYDQCSVQYIEIAAPDWLSLDADNVTDEMIRACEEVGEGTLVTDDYAAEDDAPLSALAAELSRKFKDLIFYVGCKYYWHGQQEEEANGEYVEAYVNGQEVCTL